MDVQEGAGIMEMFASNLRSFSSQKKSGGRRLRNADGLGIWLRWIIRLGHCTRASSPENEIANLGDGGDQVVISELCSSQDRWCFSIS